MNDQLEQRKPLKLWHHMLIAIGVGAVVGIATVLGQGVLPEQWNWIANSGTIWLIPAFFVSAFAQTKGKAATLGVTTLLSTVLGYYGYAMLVQHVAHTIFFISVWCGAAVVGGIIFGLAGFLWRKDQTRMHRFGSALIGGVFITEGLFILIHWQDYSHMLSSGFVKVLIGLLLVLILERSNKQRGASLLAMLPIILLGGIGYGILFFITS